MDKYGPSPLLEQTVVSLLRLCLNTQENLLMDSLYPTTGLISVFEMHTGTQRRIHFICMVCPCSFWYFPPVFSFWCIKPLFLFFVFLWVKGDVAMLLRSDFYPHNIQENLGKRYPSLFQLKQRIIFLIVAALKIRAFIFQAIHIAWSFLACANAISLNIFMQLTEAKNSRSITIFTSY